MSTVVWTLINGKYEISSLNHFLSLTKQGVGYSNTGSVPTYWTASYIQTTNINFSGLTMTPIGGTPVFTGSYDGQNYELQNWQNAGSSNNQAIFGVVTSGTFKNIVITGVTKVVGGTFVGILTGVCTGVTISNIILNLSQNSTINAGSTTGAITARTNGTVVIEYIRIKGYLTINSSAGPIGGVIGNTGSTSVNTFRDIIYSATGDIICSTGNAGGIIGNLAANSQNIVGLINEMIGSISATGSYCGGIASISNGSSTISSCINKMQGNITASSFYAGGIIGSTAGNVQDCINIMQGNIVATNHTGGIGFSSAIGYIRNVVAIKGNCKSILVESTFISSTTNVYNNVFSNRFGMTVNNAILTTSSAQNGTYVLLDTFPTTELTTNGTIKTFNSNTFVPIWTYTYTDSFGINRTITSDDSNIYFTKKYNFNFNFNQTKPVYANIGIGKTTAIKTLDINGDINISNKFYKNSNALYFWNKNSNQDTYLNSGNVGIGKTNPVCLLDVNGDIKAQTFIDFSDMNLKENIIKDDLGLEFINSLKPKTFKYINTIDNKLKHGLIAQDLVVSGYSNFICTYVSTDESEYLSLQITSLLGPMVNSIKELSEKNEILKEKINLYKNNL